MHLVDASGQALGRQFGAGSVEPAGADRATEMVPDLDLAGSHQLFGSHQNLMGRQGDGHLEVSVRGGQATRSRGGGGRKPSARRSRCRCPIGLRHVSQNTHGWSPGLGNFPQRSETPRTDLSISQVNWRHGIAKGVYLNSGERWDSFVGIELWTREVCLFGECTRGCPCWTGRRRLPFVIYL